MPLYDFKCPECEKIIEDIFVDGETFFEDTKFTCECGAEMKKIFSKPATAIFKGNGFYETDYKKKSKDSV